MSENNPNSRLEAFCDGVFAIALTLLIIDVKLPSSESIQSTPEFWRALGHIAPSIFAFILSFGIILITWVNHHAALKLVQRSSVSFTYANGFLLFTVVVMPFPTALLGEHLLTNHAAPAVVLYECVMALQAIGWILMARSAVGNHLEKSEQAGQMIRRNGTFGYYALALYSLCAIVAIWFPLAIAVVTTIIWIFWLVYGITMKHEG